MEKTVKWGVLSTADIGVKSVLPAMIDARNAEMVAIGSPTVKKREAIASAFRIPNQYDTYEGVLTDPDVEAVYIPLPNSLHKEWVIKAAEAGKHVLVEKPIALSVKDAVEMVEACQKNGVLMMEAMMYQFHPQHAFVKELIKSGEIGELKSIRSSLTFNIGENPGKNIRLIPELGGGALYDLGCYCIHSSRFILDSEPKELYVQGVVDPEYGVEVEAQGLLKMKNGATALFDCGFHHFGRDHYEIVGSKGSIHVEIAIRPDKIPDGEVAVHIQREGKPMATKHFSGDPYILEIEHFSDCIITGNEPCYTPKQSLANLKAIQAAYASLKSHDRVVL